jgi:hypothetical protein
MNVKRTTQLLIISFLFFGLAGGVSMVAAADTSFNPGYGADSDFLSPGWAPAKYTSSYSDPDFFSSTWKTTKINYSYADPDFFTSTWAVPTYTPKADASFLNSNWSVQAPVLFMNSGRDSSQINNTYIDPFMSDSKIRAQLIAQGWEIKGDFW